MYSPEHLQHGRLAAASRSKEEINKATHASVDNTFDKHRFVDEIGA